MEEIDPANFVSLERRDRQIEVSPLSKRLSASSAVSDVSQIHALAEDRFLALPPVHSADLERRQRVETSQR
jgi:hypothetical protein